jgi:hypothetical protein
MRARTAARAAAIAAGGDPPLAIRLARPIDPFDAWVWFKASRPLTPLDLDLLDGVWTAWHLLGRLGGFNGTNLQLFHGDGIATEKYDGSRLEGAGSCLFHDAGDVEAGPGGGVENASSSPPPSPPPATAHWARAWVNLGTADELALDVLANALGTLAKECVVFCFFFSLILHPHHHSLSLSHTHKNRTPPPKKQKPKTTETSR